mmetsp:Transcript_40238/g.110639  ORF Transcript_40238/g.110639 Transcript_40238/m.110639 type:complete len:228 (+) Transcript_40238:1438-2121(+)
MKGVAVAGAPPYAERDCPGVLAGDWTAEASGDATWSALSLATLRARGSRKLNVMPLIGQGVIAGIKGIETARRVMPGSSIGAFCTTFIASRVTHLRAGIDMSLISSSVRCSLAGITLRGLVGGCTQPSLDISTAAVSLRSASNSQSTTSSKLMSLCRPLSKDTKKASRSVGDIAPDDNAVITPRSVSTEIWPWPLWSHFRKQSLMRARTAIWMSLESSAGSHLREGA